VVDVEHVQFRNAMTTAGVVPRILARMAQKAIIIVQRLSVMKAFTKVANVASAIFNHGSYSLEIVACG
jgi:hypothetical protein